MGISITLFYISKISFQLYMEKFTEILCEECDLSGMASRLNNDSPSEALYLGYITFYKWITLSNYLNVTPHSSLSCLCWKCNIWNIWMKRSKMSKKEITNVCKSHVLYSMSSDFCEEHTEIVTYFLAHLCVWEKYQCLICNLNLSMIFLNESVDSVNILQLLRVIWSSTTMEISVNLFYISQI